MHMLILFLFQDKFLYFNNKVFNYMIIDANLAIKENLQNIFLLEFDLNSYNKDNN